MDRHDPEGCAGNKLEVNGKSACSKRSFRCQPPGISSSVYRYILSDFELSRFVVCTDAGLGSVSNREFNERGERAFIVTQSLKQLRGPVREWALEPQGWHLSGEQRTYDLNESMKRSTAAASFTKSNG